MTARLRDYIRIYDDAIPAEAIDKLRQFYYFMEKKGDVKLVDVENYARYYHVPITSSIKEKEDEAHLCHKYLAKVQLHYFQEYQKQIGISHQRLFSSESDGDTTRAYNESFFMRMYAQDCFVGEQYDARCHNSGRRFLSSVLFLTNDEQNSFHFDTPVVAEPIKAKEGRLVIFPSSWQYVHKELPPIETHPRINIYGFYSWYDELAAMKKIEEAKKS
jgi:hypothetical protein